MEEWLDPVYDAAGMGAADRWAIDDQGVPSLELMEAAGRALADATAELAVPGPVRVVCGKGNNGGDGLVAARHLSSAGFDVDVILLWPSDELSPDSTANFKRLEGIEVMEGEGALSQLKGSGAVIDAVLGTGFSGEPREPVVSAIEAINGSGAPVIACDVPSGADASTGEAVTSVRADATVTFHGTKAGHLINPAKGLCGELHVAPIGIPPGAPEGDAAGLISDRVFEMLPKRGASSTKFTSGRVSVVGGSKGLTGAVCLAAEAATRAGAGYATVAVPASLEQIFEIKMTEVMSLGVGGDGPALDAGAETAILDHCQRAAAVVLGSGVGKSEGMPDLVSSLAGSIPAPLVIDADGLSALAGRAGELAARTAPTLLTPHEGEAARLLGIDSEEVAAHRLATAIRLATSSGAVVVLKGDDSIVTDGDRIAVNDMPSPGLATAGTGDVLAGICGAFLGQGLDPFTAACAAVRIHTLAGRLAAERLGSAEAMIASDVIDSLPAALSHAAVHGGDGRVG